MTDLFGNQEVRALSWKEPFASLMLHGKIETRKWSTRYRGLVLICASQKPYTEAELMGICGTSTGAQKIFNFMNGRGIKENPGYAIAIGTLVDCRLMELEDEEKSFVEFWGHLYCHIYEDVQPIEPIPFKGQQGWKKLDQAFIDKIKVLK